ncbi:aldo/keto reductase [Bartonella sp. DGB1]|uniref:aldo/keto reductase n=1 Tax=Bartonella sp. DGB1 TaxID=3239807 RepID=UPI0035264EEB
MIKKRLVKKSNLLLTTLGFGSATLGNLYRETTDAESLSTANLAYDKGINYFDTAPYYGFGLSERRLGNSLRGKDFIISTKVGRLLKPIVGYNKGIIERHGFMSPMPFEPIYDYSYDAIMKSWEESIQRLGLDKIDILYIHDIGKLTHADKADYYFEQLTKGRGFAALEELRQQKLISAFGIGVNEWEIAADVVKHADIDLILLAGRYSLLEQESLKEFFPLCVANNVSVVVGGPYNSGILAVGTKSNGVLYYNYQPAPEHIVKKVKLIEALCEKYNVTLGAAALQFPLANETVVSVIPGMRSEKQVLQSFNFMQEKIPLEFWQQLKEHSLLNEDAPIPNIEG